MAVKLKAWPCLQHSGVLSRIGTRPAHRSAPTFATIGVGSSFRFPLPPNRTCGFPASGSPVCGLPQRGLVLPRVCFYRVSKRASRRERLAPQLQPRFLGTQLARFELYRVGTSTACPKGVSPCGHFPPVSFPDTILVQHPHSCPPSLHPLLVPGFIATMRALTPDAVHLPALRQASSMGARSPRFIRLDLPTIPSTITHGPSLVGFAQLCAARLFCNDTAACANRFSMVVFLLVRASPYQCRLAEIRTPNRFVILRTGCSPSVALHATSLGLQLRLTTDMLCLPGRDLHSAGRARFRAH